MVRVRTRDVRKLLKHLGVKNIKTILYTIEDIEASGLNLLLNKRMQNILNGILNFDVMFVQGFKHYVKRNRAN